MNPIRLSIITVTRNRTQQLIESAALSLQQQTDSRFEWIVINDGGDKKTKNAIARLKSDFSLVYADLEHSQTGFGLCYGRNRGLELATGNLVAYLDDDNQLKPNFVERTIDFLETNPQIRFAMPMQQRRRDIIQGGKTVKSGKPFRSPLPNTTTVELIEQKQLFDSNGMASYRIDAPSWNPNYRIYCDYEYFLQCLNVWHEDKFALLPEVLVDYVQTNDGVIGRSSYRALELERIISEAKLYSILQTDPNYLKSLRQLQQKITEKQQNNSVPEAFKI
jgi:glycosyltransferase involved in cell wall biosynthesis